MLAFSVIFIWKMITTLGLEMHQNSLIFGLEMIKNP